MDNDYKLKGTVGVILHTEAIAMPFALNVVRQVINPENGNDRIIAKFNYGIEAIRENLIHILTGKSSAPAEPGLPKAEVKTIKAEVKK